MASIPRNRRLQQPEWLAESIDAIWLDGPVPARYWADRKNRRRYLYWLGQQLGFRAMEDWYQLTTEHLKSHHGGTQLGLYWNSSALNAVQECFPLYDWKPWLFQLVPKGYWKQLANQQEYLTWLGEQLGYQRWEDWYQLSNEDVARHSGGAILHEYDSTVSAAVMACFPEHDWKPWLFRFTPKHYWDAKQNRHHYLDWLGQQLGYRCLDDWYQLRVADVREHHGKQLLQDYYQHSAIVAVKDRFPRHGWLEWKFPRVPAQFWQDSTNRWQYLVWLADRLGIERAEQWQQLRRQDFTDNYGGALLMRYRSHRELVHEFQQRLDVQAYRRRARITKARILSWADAHRELHGRWPTCDEPVPESKLTWYQVDIALRLGSRGLPGGESLADLLAEGERVERFHPNQLTTDQILDWADAHHARIGSWPRSRSGAVQDTGHTWEAIDQALSNGSSSLASGSSLARLLKVHRGVRNLGNLASLTSEQILTWADDHHRKTGVWPNPNSGPVECYPDENWRSIDLALFQGHRGLPGGSTLTQLLAAERGVRNPRKLPRLTIRQILKWADEHYAATGEWPTKKSGSIQSSAGDSWHTVHNALCCGRRGLRGRMTLLQLLAKKRGVRNRTALPPLTLDQIVRWADAHYQRTGKWPRNNSGPIDGTSGETWSGVNSALRTGARGLAGNLTLAKLLTSRRWGRGLLLLTVNQILQWADAHHKRHGAWPKATSGPIDGSNDTWLVIDSSLRNGLRGLPGGSSLARLLAQHRGVPNRSVQPRLTTTQILEWADAHHKQHGVWPNINSGPATGQAGENWKRIHNALVFGNRGLPGGSSLAKLLSKHRGVRHRSYPPRLKIREILRWAEGYRATNGEWPKNNSGAVQESNGDTWRTIDSALKQGLRGLPGGSSLFKLLSGRRVQRSRKRSP